MILDSGSYESLILKFGFGSDFFFLLNISTLGGIIDFSFSNAGLDNEGFIDLGDFSFTMLF